jgi:hypothetical protein
LGRWQRRVDRGSWRAASIAAPSQAMSPWLGGPRRPQRRAGTPPPSGGMSQPLWAQVLPYERRNY